RLPGYEQVGRVLRQVRQRHAGVLLHWYAAERLAALSDVQLHAAADDDGETPVADRRGRCCPRHVTLARGVSGQKGPADGDRARRRGRSAEYGRSCSELLQRRRTPAVEAAEPPALE